MNETLKMPWSIKDTTENLKELKEILKTHVRKSNYEGKGESDAAYRLTVLFLRLHMVTCTRWKTSVWQLRRNILIKCLQNQM